MRLHDNRAKDLVYTDAARTRPVTVTVIDYDAARLDERVCTRPGDFRDLITRPTVTWVDVDGVHDAGVIREVGEAVGIHPLILEDIANTR